MKIRTGFVSNSSSSSYVCDVSGEAFEVQDGCFWDAGLCQCKNGHTFQKKFLVPWEKPVVTRKDMLAKLESITDSKRECQRFQEMSDAALQAVYAEKCEDYTGYASNVNECPICTMTRLSDKDLIAYLLRRDGVDRGAVENQIRSQFESYAQFQRYIKK